MNINDLIDKKEVTKAIDHNNSSGQNNVGSIFWRIPEGKSLVRLLPRPESKVPWKTVWTHRNGVDGALGTCIRTWGEKNCPICAKSWQMHESEIKTIKDLGYSVRKGARYFFNVFVVKDDTNEEMNGQIRLMSVGKKLFELILEAYDSEDLGVSVFDAVKGFNLEINKKMTAGEYPDYTSSRFLVKTSNIGSWEEIQPKLMNIDETTQHDTKEDLLTKFNFLFDETPAVSYKAEDSTPASTTVESEEIKSKDDTDKELEDLLAED